jgi:anti-anti-sigma factor
LVRPGDFRIETESLSPGVCRLTPVGELDLATAPRLQSELDRAVGAGAARVVVDLSQVGFLDSTGLRMFLALSERAGAEGWVLTLTAPSDAVRAMLEITGSSGSLPLEDG